jgi:N-methylhydantoinase A
VAGDGPKREGGGQRRARVGIDVGGSFTDLVAAVDGELVTAKVPSTPDDQSEGVLASVRASDVEPQAVDTLAHGMTVATNALLERQGARTALVTSEGFRDVVEIGRQNRPSLYDLTKDRPPPLVPRELRFTVRERMGPDGEIEPLDGESLEVTVRAVRDAEVEAVAVCLLFAFLHPEHEQRVGEALRDALPDAHVSMSSEVLREFREYERFATTACDAYLGPRLAAYLGHLATQTEEAGMPKPLVMQSSGGVVGIDDAARGAAAVVMSGPAGGVVGAAHVAESSGHSDVLTFDMGGTSTDVATVSGGRVATTTESEVAGVPIKLPMVDIHTVSAGGGSIAWVDEGGALRVGPRSAGARPGPAAYDLGGEDPTVTDANLALGYLAEGAELGGEVVLRAEKARAALERIGQRLGLDASDAATGAVRVTNAEMVRALRVISVERGLDPREFGLVAFGGAGPMHACALAEELDMRTVLVPRAGGVLSALGLAISDVRRDYVHPLLAPLDEVDRRRLDDAFGELESSARGDLDDPECERRADLRYRGQSFELSVDADDLEAANDLADRFHAAHEQRYGYRLDEEPVELVNVRVTGIVRRESPELREGDPPGDDPVRERRQASFDGEWAEVPVLDRSRMGRGSRVEGPAIVELAEATCVVRPGWAGEVDSAGTIVLERSG